MQYYIGIDFHMQYSSIAVLDQNGNLLEERKLYHAEKEKFIAYFLSFPKDNTSIAVEATRNWYWLVDLLQELGFSVKLAYAKKARIIAESTIKTDKFDARILAQLDRSNFLPQAYIADKETRSSRELLRYYMGLVSIRTSVKNKIHTVLAKNNIHHGFTDLFGLKGLAFLKELELAPIYRMELNGYLKLLSHLKQATDNTFDKIRQRCKETKYVKRLMTVPGIAYFTALLLSAEIADITRFKNSKKFACYAGLVSSTHQSADKEYHGHIIKDSNKYIRCALVEAVTKAIHKDPRLWIFYKRIQRKKGTNKARIATARKMLTIIYSMLKNNTDYRIDKKIDTSLQAISEVRVGA